MNRVALAAALRDAADIFKRLASAVLAEDAGEPNEHLSLEEARQLGKLRTTRSIRDAARAVAWLESRRTPAVSGAADADIDRRIQRIEARQRRAAHRAR